MSKLDQLQLISNDNIFYNGTCTLRHATLDDVKRIGLSKYNEYLNILHLDVETFNDQFGSKFDSENISIFDILSNTGAMRDFLCEALSFFIVENVFYEPKYSAFKVDGDKTTNVLGIINRNNYSEIANGILQLNFIKDDEIAPEETKNSKLKNILKKFKKGRAKLAKSKTGDSNINIPNMISSIVAYGNNYNYENIWSLTVYQLYDLFFRLNVKTQLDITGLRWAAWGKDEFDFSVWYKDPTKKK